MERSTLGSRLLILLREQHLNQKQLAQKAGITEAALSHYIKGDRVPRASVIAKIATALGTTTDYLLGGKQDIMNVDFSQTRRLIARNAQQMTLAEKKELIDILLGAEE